jgi:hypothetical protein
VTLTREVKYLPLVGLSFPVNLARIHFPGTFTCMAVHATVGCVGGLTVQQTLVQRATGGFRRPRGLSPKGIVIRFGIRLMKITSGRR